MREGVYFTEMEEERLQEIFRNALDAGDTYITLKCASQDVYQQMRKSLIDEQKIFRYLDISGESVSYSENEKQYSMSFWL